MLRALIGLSALLLSLPASGSIQSLWKEYEKADKSDSPKEQIAILQKIKNEARAEKSAWDYYHAGELCVSVGSRRNWKLRTRSNRHSPKSWRPTKNRYCWFMTGKEIWKLTF